jgi:8-oxo-dGTP pyrophosphatase MutT (NUDIX family)
LIEPGANMRDTATRELLEETGLTATGFLPDDAGQWEMALVVALRGVTHMRTHDALKTP